MLANVKIEQDKENPNIHKVFADGKRIEKITHLDFQVNPLEFPKVTLNLETMSGIDFEGQAEVNFLETPFTVENALTEMKRICLRENIDKIAMPTIGAGLDRLFWDEVAGKIKEVFADTDIEIMVCKL